MEIFDKILQFFTSPIFKLGLNVTIFFLILLWLSVVYWVYRDAVRRGASGIFWAMVTLILGFFGLILYFILRPPEFKEDALERELEIEAKERLVEENPHCPACGKRVEVDFLICPYCRKKLKNSCTQCGRPLQLNWVVCPYCRYET